MFDPFSPPTVAAPTRNTPLCGASPDGDEECLAPGPAPGLLWASLQHTRTRSRVVPESERQRASARAPGAGSCAATTTPAPSLKCGWKATT
jgi:hypothetical protein